MQFLGEQHGREGVYRAAAMGDEGKHLFLAWGRQG